MSGTKWLLLAALLVAPTAAATNSFGQQVHLLLVGETADRTIGDSVRHDLEATAGAFNLLLQQGHLDLTRLEGEQVSVDGVLTAIDHFSVKPEDALVCYWSGHGAFDDDGHYLKMHQGGNLRRSTLLGALKKKQARLVVLLTDCCNQYSDTTVGKHVMSPPASSKPPTFALYQEMFLKPQGPTVPGGNAQAEAAVNANETGLKNQTTCPLFDELFLTSRGVVDVNAASQGELALNTNDGGLFTLSLMCTTVGRGAADGDQYRSDKVLGAFWRNARKRIDWPTLIQESRRQVQEFFEQINPDGLVGRDGTTYHKQTVVAFSLPGETAAKSARENSSRFGVEAVDNDGDGVLVVRIWPDYPGAHVTDATGKTLSIDRGDVILTINGKKICNLTDYADAVNSSPQTMKLTVRDVNDGSKHEVEAKLRDEATK